MDEYQSGEEVRKGGEREEVRKGVRGRR